eukprot:TRINITY_DN14364_c0_g2_i5.p1 TRINITY_DN14364_c0_g2~~TRINITY_DN14364_c0_g2_i5.p1  ORF type:complete len:300 (-),score=69.81 TRINITY_DN14364_c0_g2_i5:63-962(-)
MSSVVHVNSTGSLPSDMHKSDNNDSRTVPLTVVLSTGIVLTAVSLVIYVCYEMRKHGWSKLSKNKTVMVSLLGITTTLVDFSLLEAFVLEPSQWVFKSSVLMYIITSICHLTLVYLRSLALFVPNHTSDHLMRLIKVLGALFILLVVFLIVEFILGTYITLSLEVMEAAIIPAGIVFVLIDIVCSIAFGRRVRKISSLFRESRTMVSQGTSKNTDQTEMIASRGLVTCVVSFCSVILFWVALVLTKDSATQNDATWVYVVQRYMSLTVMALWLWLKIQLDSKSTDQNELKQGSSGRQTA